MDKIEKKKSQSVAERVQALYAKNKVINSIIDSSQIDVRVWSEKDGLPLPEGCMLREITGLPCIPFNKIIQTAGKPDTGKSTNGTELVVAAQKAKSTRKWKVVYWDTEEKLDVIRLKKVGGDPDSMEVIRTNLITVGGQLLKDYIDMLMSDEDANIFVAIDSIGGAVSRGAAEINRITKKNGQPGQEAKEWGQVVRDLVSIMNKYRDRICVYMANQTYAKIGFMQKGDKAKGGDGVEYLSSVIVFLKRLKVLTGEVTGPTGSKKLVKKGIITQATVTKNHLTQTDTSTYQMNFEINALGSKPSTFSFKKADDASEEEDDES